MHRVSGPRGGSIRSDPCSPRTRAFASPDGWLSWEEAHTHAGRHAECIRFAIRARVRRGTGTPVAAFPGAISRSGWHSRGGDQDAVSVFGRRSRMYEPEPPHSAAENTGRLQRCEPHITAVSGSTTRGPLPANRRNLRRSSRHASSPFAEIAGSAVCLAVGAVWRERVSGRRSVLSRESTGNFLEFRGPPRIFPLVRRPLAREFPGSANRERRTHEHGFFQAEQKSP
jgi:hypothetical protein